MRASEQPQRALSFGGVAAAYERSRPSYPADAVRWLVGGERRTGQRVLDLGAGTGRLARQLAAMGRDVVAVEPSEAMLAELRSAAPDLPCLVGTAEAIPAADDSFDVVVVAQAFHWFDKSVAVPEIARVLRPSGQLALMWNVRDPSVPWVRDLWATIAPDESERIEHAKLPPASPFGPFESAVFTHDVLMDRQSVLDLALSRSYVAVKPPEQRAALLAAAGKILDEHSGSGALRLPYRTLCYRTPVTDTL